MQPPNWRGHIGLIHPTHRGRNIKAWYVNLPDGIEVSPAILGFATGKQSTFDGSQVLDAYRDYARTLVEWGCQVVVAVGSPPFILRGGSGERTWRDEVRRELGVPLITGMAPHVAAAQALGARRVAVLTYYGDVLNTGIATQFTEQDLDPALVLGYPDGGKPEGLYSVSMTGLQAVTSADVYRFAKQAVRGAQVDAVYLNGGGWDATPAVEHLECDLGLPVYSATTAEIWLSLAVLHVLEPVNGLGRLLADGRLRQHRVVDEWRGPPGQC